MPVKTTDLILGVLTELEAQNQYPDAIYSTSDELAQHAAPMWARGAAGPELFGLPLRRGPIPPSNGKTDLVVVTRAVSASEVVSSRLKDNAFVRRVQESVTDELMSKLADILTPEVRAVQDPDSGRVTFRAAVKVTQFRTPEGVCVQLEFVEGKR